MITTLLTLPVRGKRDIVVARQRARQIAGLLGYPRREQVVLSAMVFDLARRSFEAVRSGQLQFQVEDHRLHVVPVPDTAGLRLIMAIPDNLLAPCPEDWPWLVRQLAQLTPLDLFEELRQQNQDILLVLGEIPVRRSEIDHHRFDQQLPAA